VLPVFVVVAVNLAMTALVLPRLDTGYLAEERWGETSLSAAGGVWAVMTALLAAIVVLVVANRRRLPALRESVDAGSNASVLPALNTASLVGFGAVVAALPAFAVVRDGLLALGGGPLISLGLATSVIAGITGSASGGLTIALDALGQNFAGIAEQGGHRPRADAPRCRHRSWQSRCTAAQRRGGNAPGRLWCHAPGELPRHRDGSDGGTAARARLGNHPGLDPRVLLRVGPERFSEGSTS
jgi:hypothetical protein